MSCIYHDRTKGAGRGRVNSISVPSKIFTDRAKAALQLWFTISVVVCLCMYVLVKCLIWIADWPHFGKEIVHLVALMS